MIKASALRPQSTIGIIAPSSPLRDELKLQKGISYLEKCGYRVELGKSVSQHEHYLSGSDALRANDIEHMFANPNIDAIFCTRGGYGVMRLLEQLNYRIIKQNPKIFVGFSDLTALSCAIMRKTGLVTFSGAMVAVDMHDFDSESEEQFWRVLSSKKKLGRVRQSLPLQTLNVKAGTKGTKVQEGHLVCGNLSLLAALTGSAYAPLYKDAVLLSEDIGEEAYKIDRLLCQLELSGALRASSGLVFGQFTDDKQRQSATPSRNILDVLKEYAQRANKSAISNCMYGHTAKKLTLPFGVRCSFHSSLATFSIDESGVE